MSISEVVYSYMYSLYKYVCTSWPINVIYGPHYTPASDDTRQKLLDAIQLVKGTQVGWSYLSIKTVKLLCNFVTFEVLKVSNIKKRLY